MDPVEDRRNTKRQEEYYNRMGNVADSEYGIPRRCPCGGRIRDEVRVKEEYDTLPGKRFFTCPWVIGVQEEIESLRRRVEKAEQVIKLVPNLNKHIDTVEAEVNRLSLVVDNLTAEIYSLTVQVANLEKACFE
ncbi:hypothetical protein YC2023_077413 [Brassica napus]